MKTTLNALVFVALAATCAATPGTAWLGDWAHTPEDPPTQAIAVNHNLVKNFVKTSRWNGLTGLNEVVFEIQDEGLSQSVNPTDICRGTIGIEVGGEMFCGLYRIILLKTINNDVLLIMRFDGLNWVDRECQLEVPIFKKTNQNEIIGDFKFLNDDWYDRIGINSPDGNIIPFNFGWFKFILDHKVLESADGYPVQEELADPAAIYITRRVLLPKNAMTKLRSIQ